MATATPVAAVRDAKMTSIMFGAALGGVARGDATGAAGDGAEAVETLAAGAAAGFAGAAGADGVAVGAAGAAGAEDAPPAGMRMDGPAEGLGGRLIRTVCFLAEASAGFGGSTGDDEGAAGGTDAGAGVDGVTGGVESDIVAFQIG